VKRAPLKEFARNRWTVENYTDGAEEIFGDDTVNKAVSF
jgi:hypothetical protein